jgi:hypothetical protein
VKAGQDALKMTGPGVPATEHKMARARHEYQRVEQPKGVRAVDSAGLTEARARGNTITHGSTAWTEKRPQGKNKMTYP